MATFRTVARPATRPCLCGSKMTPATRYEATRTVDVWCCWTCGLEDPPLYAGTEIVRRACRWCGVRYTARVAPGASVGACSDECKRRSAHYHQMRMQQGQQTRKRRAS